MANDLFVGTANKDIVVTVDAAMAINGVGVPEGGAEGQVLLKASASNFDTEWADVPTTLPSGGDVGQLLTKISSTPYDAAWQDPPPALPIAGNVGDMLVKLSPANYDVGWQPALNAAAFVAKSGDTMAGPLFLSSDPSGALEAAPKQYVDTAIAATGATYAPLASPTLTGNPKAPTPSAGDNDTSIATTAFVQGELALYLPLVGGTLSNFLTLHSGPINDFHAATKIYVDNLVVGKADLAYVDTQLALKANLTGAAFTGNISTTGSFTTTGQIIANNTVEVNSGIVNISSEGLATPSLISLSADPGQPDRIRFYDGDIPCWDIVKDMSRDFAIRALDNTGATTFSAITIARSNGIANFSGTPTAPTAPDFDSSTKLATTEFVQGAVTGAGSGVFIPFSGGTLTGYLTLYADPSAPLHAATKQYVDNKVTTYATLASPTFTGDPQAPTPSPGDSDSSIATTAFVTNALGLYLPKIGGALTGALLLHADPTVALQAATKQYVDSGLALKATLASPTFTGDPKAPTPAAGDNDTSIATTQFVTRDFLAKTGGTLTGALTLSSVAPTADHAVKKSYVDNALITYAPLASPVLTGNPTAPTPLTTDNDTSIATTAYVKANVASYLPLAGGTLTGALTLPAISPIGDNEATRKKYVDDALALKATLASPALTGNPTAPTPTAGDNDTSIATTQFVTRDFLKLTGGILTGALTVTTGDVKTTNGVFVIDHTGNGIDSDLFLVADNNASALIRMRTGTTDRWRAGKGDDTEAGSNSGSNYIIKAYNDAGITSYEVLNISRATQVAAFAKTPTAPTATSGDASLQLATTEFVTDAIAGATITGGVPAGGTTDQVLAKASNTNYDLKWTNSAGAGTFLALTGGTMTGKLTLDPVDQTAANDAATRGYAESLVTSKASLASPVFTGNPTAPTPATADNDTSIATTAYVQANLANYILEVGGTMTGALTLSSVTPTADHAVKKSYVDDALDLKSTIASPTFTGDPKAPTPATTDNDTSIATTAYVKANLANYIAETGGIMTGALTLPAITPVGVNDATRKQYVNDQDNLRALKAGDTFTGLMTFNGAATFNGETIVADTPTAPTHAANKAYVDLKASITYVDTELLDYAKLAGATFTGGVTVNSILNVGNSLNINPVSATAHAQAILTSDVGYASFIYFAAAAGHRWRVGRFSNAETGSNVGSDFYVTSYDDAGVQITHPFVIRRSTGRSEFSVAPISIVQPIEGDDIRTLATLKYVDDTVAGAGAGIFLPIAGGTLQGDLVIASTKKLTLGAVPTSNMHAVNLSYLTSNYIAKTGGIYTGAVTFNENVTFETTAEVIVKLTASVSTHAANKGYVDSHVATAIAGKADKSYVDSELTEYAKLIGATFTGNVRTTGGYFQIDRSDDAQPAQFWFTTDKNQINTIIFRVKDTSTEPDSFPTRWQIYKTSTAEGANNVGADLAIHAYDNAGGSIGNALTITRATRVTTFGAVPVAPTPASEAGSANPTGKVVNTTYLKNYYLSLLGGALSGGLTVNAGSIITYGGYIMASRAGDDVDGAMYIDVDDGRNSHFNFRSAPVGGSQTSHWRLLFDTSKNFRIQGGAGLQNTIQMNYTSQIVSFLKTPTAPTVSISTAPGTELATTQYVVNKVAAGYLPLSGGPMTGHINMQSHQVQNCSALTMTGAIDMNNHAISEVSDITVSHLNVTGTTPSINMYNNPIHNVGALNISTGPIFMNDKAINACGGLNMNASSNIVFPAGASGNLIMGGTARISNSGAPAAITDGMRPRDMVSFREMGNYNFSDFDWNAAGKVPEGWIRTGGSSDPIIIDDSGGTFGGQRMRIYTNTTVQEAIWHPVDVTSIYECCAEVAATNTSTVVSIGIWCADWDFNVLNSGSPRWVGVHGWPGFPSLSVRVGGCVTLEGDQRFQFPPGTRYIKRVIQLSSGSGHVDVDHFIFRQLNNGEEVNGEMFGMRKGGTLNQYGEWNAYAIEGMLWYLMINGGVGRIPAGTYDLGLEVSADPSNGPAPSSGITVPLAPKAFTIEGYGDASIIRKSAPHPNHQSAGSYTSHISGTLLEIINCHNVTLRNFKVDGNATTWPTGPLPDVVGNSGTAGTSSGTYSGYDYGHSISLIGGHYVTVDGVHIRYCGKWGGMIYIVGRGSADSLGPAVTIERPQVINCYLDGRNNAGNGVLIGWANNGRIANTTAINVRSTVFNPYWFTAGGVHGYYEFATPGMGLQYKHANDRPSIENCTAINCRNGASFTPDDSMINYARITGLTVQMGDGAANGVVISGSYGGSFTGITINGGKYKNTDPGLRQAVGLTLGGSDVGTTQASAGNFVECTLEWFDTTDQNDTNEATGAVRPLQFTGDAHDNYVQVSSIADCGVRPVIFEENSNQNFVEVGMAASYYDTLATSFCVDATSGANVFRYKRDPTYQIKTANVA